MSVCVVGDTLVDTFARSSARAYNPATTLLDFEPSPRTMASTVIPFSERPHKKICLFDVDGPLTPARQVRVASRPALIASSPPRIQPASPEILEMLAALRKKCAIGFVGGSDFVKIAEQLSPDGVPGARARRRDRVQLTLRAQCSRSSTLGSPRTA